MRFYLTTAIDYVNSRPHLGTAYEKITADVIARYKRLTGAETHFLMGNDEHSQNVYTRARELGEDPLAYCDRMDAVFREVWAGLDISFDDFIRTTEPRHKTAVQQLAQRSADAGDIYEGVYEGWYCESCEAFKQEKDLVDGLCPIHLRKPDWIREKNCFFRLSAYRDRLLQHFEADPRFLQPDFRRNEIIRLLEAGSKTSRSAAPARPGASRCRSTPKSVVYVWFDALINYAAAVGYGTDDDAVREVVAGRSPCHREGHHPVPLRRLAGDAAERRRRAAAAGVRSWLGPSSRQQDEQEHGHGDRSDRSRAAPGDGRASSLPHEGDCLRQRRRLFVGAVRREVQRRSGQQSWQPRRSPDDTGAKIRRPAASGADEVVATRGRRRPPQ